jgi:hypothetical protein
MNLSQEQENTFAKVEISLYYIDSIIYVVFPKSKYTSAKLQTSAKLGESPYFGRSTSATLLPNITALESAGSSLLSYFGKSISLLHARSATCL